MNIADKRYDAAWLYPSRMLPRECCHASRVDFTPLYSPLLCAERSQCGDDERVAQGAESLRIEGIEGH